MKALSKEKAIKVMLINIVVVYLIASMSCFFFDGFVIHPIPKQAGSDFDIRKSNTVYADATILDVSFVMSAYGTIYLVEWQEDVHLLYFSHHFPTGRFALTSNVIIETDALQQTEIGTVFEHVTVQTENRKIDNVFTGPLANRYLYIYGTYGMLITLVESVILWKILKKRIN